MQKVVVAFENETNSAKIREILESGGVASCIVCRSAAEVKRVVQKQRLCLVVCGFKLVDGPCEDLFQDLPDGCSMLMIAPQAGLELCETEEIVQLPAPVQRGDLISSVSLLLKLSGKYAGGHAERTQEERALIEQAKGVLMDRHGMTEEQAHRFLQKESMNHGARLTDTARLVLTDD